MMILHVSFGSLGSFGAVWRRTFGAIHDRRAGVTMELARIGNRCRQHLEMGTAKKPGFALVLCAGLFVVGVELPVWYDNG